MLPEAVCHGHAANVSAPACPLPWGQKQGWGMLFADGVMPWSGVFLSGCQGELYFELLQFLLFAAKAAWALCCFGPTNHHCQTYLFANKHCLEILDSEIVSGATCSIPIDCHSQFSTNSQPILLILNCINYPTLLFSLHQCL